MPFDPSANYYEDPSDYDSELEQAQNPLAANPQLALRNPPPVTAPGPWSQKRDAAATQLADQGNVRPALWRSLLAGGAEFMLGRRHPQAAQVFGDAITQSDPNVRANLNLQRRYGVLEKQAEQERLQQTQQRMEQYQQGLLGARARALDANTQAGQEKRLAQAANNGFTPSPSSVDLPAPGAVPSPDLPPPIRAMSPQTMNTPLPPGALPPLAPVGSVPAKVSGQQGYYIPPAERERMKKQADAKAAQEARQQALQERGIPTPPAIKAVVPGIGDRILPEEAQHYSGLINADTKANAPDKTPQRDDRAIAIYSKPVNQRTPEEKAFIAGYEKQVNVTKTQPGMERMGVLAGTRVVQVVDPNDPNMVRYMPAGEAGSTGATAPASIPFQTTKATTKSFTTGPNATTLTNINTAHEHIAQLSKVADALHNGNFPVVNQVANAYAQATGQPAPATFQLVKTAVEGEIAKTFTGGVATVEEGKQLSKAINAASSPAQLRDVLAGATKLMESKRANLKKQYQQGMQGQPNFGDNGIGGGGDNQQTYTHTATGPNNHKIGSNDGKTWFDVQTGKPIQ